MKTKIIEVGYAKNIDSVNYVLGWRFGTLLEACSVEELTEISDTYWDKWKLDNPETPFPYTKEAILMRISDQRFEDEARKFIPYDPYQPLEEYWKC